MEKSYSTNLYTKLAEGYFLTFDEIFCPVKLCTEEKEAI